MAKKLQYAVTDSNGNKVSHETGTYYSPEPQEALYVIGKLLETDPDCGPASAVYSLTVGKGFEDYRKDLGKYIPFILEYFLDRERTHRTVCILWTLSCWWAQYEHGPRPDGTRKPKQKQVDTESWRDNLVCPVCNTLAPCQKATGDYKYVTSLYAKWLVEHAKGCQKKVSLGTAMKRLREKDRLEDKKGTRLAEYRKKLEALGEAGTEIFKELQAAQNMADKAYRLMDAQEQSVADKTLFLQRYQDLQDHTVFQVELREQAREKLLAEVAAKKLEEQEHIKKLKAADTRRRQRQAKKLAQE
jgi:hypothetical protein